MTSESAHTSLRKRRSEQHRHLAEGHARRQGHDPVHGAPGIGDPHADPAREDQEQPARPVASLDDLLVARERADVEVAGESPQLFRSQPGQHRMVRDVDGRRLAKGGAVPIEEGVLGPLQCGFEVGEHPAARTGEIRMRVAEQGRGIDEGDRAAATGEFVAQTFEHAARDAADVVHPPHVDHHDLELVLDPADLAHRGLRAGEEQVSVQLVDPAALADVVEGGPLGGSAPHPRRTVDDGVRGTDRRPGGAGDVQEVQLQVVRQGPARLHPAHAVAVRVEARRVDGDADLAGQDRERCRRRRRSWQAARPRTTHLPAASYMPHVDITLRTRSTRAGSRTVSRVTGLTPLFAIVAAIRLRSRHVTSMEHWRK